MTNRNRRQTATRRSVAKRGNLWLPFDVSTTLNGGSSISLTSLLDRYLADHGAELPVGSTLGPIRGMLSFKAATDTEVIVRVFAAIYLTPEGGLTAPPLLESEQVDAMWYTVAPWVSLLGNGPPSIMVPIQTRAMRKITDVGQELHLQLDEVAGATNVEVAGGGHIFIKLP